MGSVELGCILGFLGWEIAFSEGFVWHECGLMVWMLVADSWPACPLMWQLWPRRDDRGQVQTSVPACTTAD